MHLRTSPLDRHFRSPSMAGANPAHLRVALLGQVPLPAPLALMGGPLPAACPFRAGSKLARIDAYLRANPLQWSLGPTFIAEILMHTAFADGTSVSKQEVWTVLHEWGWTRKKKAVVPADSRPHERRAHLAVLRALWPRNPVNEDMFVFVDEKTFKAGEVKERIGDYGYAAKGTRVPLRYPFAPYTQVMPAYTGVIGALGVVAPGPLLDGRTGDLGLIAYTFNRGAALTTADIVHFFEHVLSPTLNPYPGPRSVVILDNAPGHRALSNYAQQRILIAVQRRGAQLIWNPPHSPDLNPIEHLWGVTKAYMKRRVIELCTGRLGVQRPFGIGDLIYCLQCARLTRDVYRSLLRQPE